MIKRLAYCDPPYIGCAHLYRDAWQLQAAFPEFATSLHE